MQEQGWRLGRKQVVKSVALSQLPQVTAARSHWGTPGNGSSMDLRIHWSDVGPRGSRTGRPHQLGAESLPRVLAPWHVSPDLTWAAQPSAILETSLSTKKQVLAFL